MGYNMVIRNMKDLAVAVQNYRKTNGISQTDISKLSGLKQSTISAFENKPEVTKMDTFFRILMALNLRVQILPNDLVEKQKGWAEEW